MHMCVTSPPFYGLRDYGTGRWEGGNPDCDHLGPPKASDKSGLKNDGRPLEQVGQNAYERGATVPYGRVCGKCGAERVDQQIGLEETPEQWVASLVAVFREVRRVLRDDGTLWLEVGDSYANTGNENPNKTIRKVGDSGDGVSDGHAVRFTPQPRKAIPANVKPKDLIGAPWHARLRAPRRRLVAPLRHRVGPAEPDA